MHGAKQPVAITRTRFLMVHAPDGKAISKYAFMDLCRLCQVHPKDMLLQLQHMPQELSFPLRDGVKLAPIFGYLRVNGISFTYNLVLNVEVTPR